MGGCRFQILPRAQQPALILGQIPRSAKWGGGTEAASSPEGSLSDREFEVFQLIGQGKNTREIADKLHISVKTVEVHRLNIKSKLKIGSAAELMHFAVRWVESQGAMQF